MSYEVLARKWRPLTFDDVVGQDHITRTLKKAVETDRISHAYMFAGPRGCGKTSTARILARVINCENLPGDGNPCNECSSCRAVIRGNNLDVMEIDGASHTGVNEVRDLQESIGYAPSQYRSKVYIIDEVHMLSTHAFNALLKTLEEPPRHVYFVFATTAPQKIPDTIKSRCQRHHFKRLEIKEISDRLRAICEAENVGFDDEGLRLLARKADGSMRDGTSLLDQCITSSDGNVTTGSVRDILGLIDQEKVFAFMDCIARGDATAALRLLGESVDEGLDIQELSTALLEGYRDLMILSAPGDLSDLLFRSKDEIELMRNMARRYELPDLVTVVERLCDVSPRLKTAADPRILLESLLVDLSLLDRQVDIRRLISDLGSPDGGANSLVNKEQPPRKRKQRGVENGSTGEADTTGGAAGIAGDRDSKFPRVGEGAVEAPTGVTDVPAAGPVLDFDKLLDLWDGFVTFVREKKFRLGVSLISGKPYAFDGKTMSLRFTKSFADKKEFVEKGDNIQFLKKQVARYFGREMEIACFLEGDERAVKVDQPKTAGKRPADRLRGVPEEKKPAVMKLLKEFDGEIIRHNR